LLFPRLLALASVPHLEGGVYSLCLRYFDTGALVAGSLQAHRSIVMTSWQKHLAELLPAQRADGVAWMWQDNYRRHRSLASLLLDLLQYFPSDEVLAELRAAFTQLTDPKLKFYAARSLLLLGQPIRQEDWLPVAASSEMRLRLHRFLVRVNRLDLFPAAYYTQLAFAEADLVDWLTFPSELGCVPDEIELGLELKLTSDGEEFLAYAFRFRTDPPQWAADKGWMAGVTGPYQAAQAPTTHTLGLTFSCFEAWDSQTPEEHLGDVQGIIADWRAHQQPVG
jgi:hypothetical protein